jgi:hypothetical protein
MNAGSTGNIAARLANLVVGREAIVTTIPPKAAPSRSIAAAAERLIPCNNSAATAVTNRCAGDVSGLAQVASAAADPLPQMVQLGGQLGELVVPLIVILKQNHWLLLLRQEKRPGSGLTQKPVHIKTASRACSHHRRPPTKI